MSPMVSPPDRTPRPRPALGVVGQVLGRSLFPLVALLLIAGTALWGPWVTLVLAFAWWNVITRIA